MQEYHNSITLTSKLSETKLENLAVTAAKYKDRIQKTQAAIKDKII